MTSVLKRMMPCLLFDGSGLVKTVRFRNPTYVGDPINAIKIYNEKEVDELVLLDIRASTERRPPLFDRIRAFAAECFMPFSYGGGVRAIEDFARLYKAGVEKVIVNTLCFTDPAAVRKAVDTFASSSVVGSVDYRRSFWHGPQVFSRGGQRTPRSVVEHCRYIAEEIGVGEIMLCSVDREGTWGGFDMEMVSAVARAVQVPVIASGGAGSAEDIRRVLYETDANGAAIGSMAVFQKKGMGVLINFPKREAVIVEPETI